MYYFAALCIFTNQFFSIVKLIILLQFFQLKNSNNSLFSLDLPQPLTLCLDLPLPKTLRLDLLVPKKYCLGHQQPNGDDKNNIAHMTSGISSYIDTSLYNLSVFCNHVLTLNAFFLFQMENLLEVMTQSWARLSLIS